jgi:hypothetical protein
VRFEKKSSYLKVSYNSSIIYPGARVGIEFPIQTTAVSIHKKSGWVKSFIKEKYITGNISWYHHPNFHDNVYFTAGWTMRRAKPTGFLAEFSPEIGLSRTFLGGTTYKVDNNGNVIIERFAGYYYALLSVGGGIGYDFSIAKSLPFILFSKFNIITMFPYNSTIYMRPTLEIGLIYKPANFLSLRVKSKKIDR